MEPLSSQIRPSLLLLQTLHSSFLLPSISTPVKGANLSSSFTLPLSTSTLRRSFNVTIDRRTIRKSPWPDVRALLELRLGFSAPDPLQQLLRIEIRTHRIPLKRLTTNKLIRPFHRLEIIHLRLEPVPVWIGVVHTRRRPMIHAPYRHDSMRFSLLVRRGEIVEIAEGEGNVLEASSGHRGGGQIAKGDDGDAVMLVVVGEEGGARVFKLHGGAEESLVELDHGSEVGVRGSEDDVSELDGAEDFGGWFAGHYVTM